MLDAKKSVPFVTGSNRGIGLAFVQAYLAQGARRIYAAARKRADLDAVVLNLPKTPAIDVANDVLAGIAAGTEDIFPDPTSKQFYAGWAKDHKSVERQFGSM